MNPAAPPARIDLLDQLRGYAIAGMILVNFLGDFEVMPWTLKHHREGMSYADTIAPLFVFVSGMGFRLSFLRRREGTSLWQAHVAGVRRHLTLTVVGMLFYGASRSGDGGVSPNWWDALYDIGLAGVLAAPFIDRTPTVRVVAAFLWLGVYQAIFSGTGYGEWVKGNSWNGGPLGPIPYAFVTLMGSLAMDWIDGSGAGRGSVASLASPGAAPAFARRPGRLAVELRCLAGFVVLGGLGWAMRAEWPDVKPLWHFSQYNMDAPYPLWSAALAFAALAAFHVVNVRLGLAIPTFTTLGQNALAIYVVHLTLIRVNRGWFDGGDPVWKALLGFAILYAVCWALARKFRREGIFIKV